jgi:hypothetical protein
MATLVCLTTEEALVRHLDGYRLWTVRLVRIPSPYGVDEPFRDKWVDPQQAASYVKTIQPAAGVDREWFWSSPAPFPRTPFDRDLVKQMEENPGASLQSVYSWNVEYLRHVVCTDHQRQDAVFSNIKRAFFFTGRDGDMYPAFRFLSNAHYPTGLRTNAFGWRGADIPLDKPPRTIRIAFVGSSTTVAGHGEPWSYPELVDRWLNEWASIRGVDVRFDVVNAGREGINSHSIAAIVEQELGPAKPDLIVYYEGSNQFWPDAFVRERVGMRPIQEFAPRHYPLDDYLAMSRRLHTLGAALKLEGREPPKPGLTVAWPADLSETDPDLADPRLPVNLPDIVHDLDRIRVAAAAGGSELAIASFMWLVYGGMVLNRVRDAMLFAYLNDSFGSFPYSHMRRYADFQNRVFDKYARTRHVTFLDYASNYPRDPRLFYDAIHMTTAGIRLQGWIMFQLLVPTIEQRIRSGAWPQPHRRAERTHPAIRPDRSMIATDAIRAECSQP